MSDEYTAEDLAHDIVGSLKAFWEDFRVAYSWRKPEEETTVTLVRTYENEYYVITVRRVDGKVVGDD